MVQITTSSAAVSSRYRSRKFIIAISSFVVVSAMGLFGCVKLAADGGDISLIIGAWGVVDAAILKLYNDANIAAASE